MSYELQIRSQALSASIVHLVQTRLRQTCFNKFGSLSLDHADVAAGPVVVSAADDGVQLRIPIAVYLVEDAALMSAPNQAPTGSGSAAVTVALIVSMSVSGNQVTFGYADIDLGPAVAPEFGLVTSAIALSIGPLAVWDLSGALTALGLPKPSIARIEYDGTVIAIRFDPSGALVEHLAPGQDWSLFVDGATTAFLIRQRLIDSLTKPKGKATGSLQITSLEVSSQWNPEGSVPRVDTELSGQLIVPDPLSGDAEGTFTTRMSLAPGPAWVMRLAVAWDLNIDFGAFIPGPINDELEDIARAAFQVNLVKMGARLTGGQNFSLDVVLPQLSQGGTRFTYTSIVAVPEGMIIGGAVQQPVAASFDNVQTSVTPFGVPMATFLCRELARSGSGNPPETVGLDQVRVSARLWLEDCGALCAIEIISPGAWIEQYMSRPPDGTVAETIEVRISIPGRVARTIQEPVRLIVHSARGVRLINLGQPPLIELDANRQVSNAVISFIDNCFYIPGESAGKHGLVWGEQTKLDRKQVDPPLEDPNWKSFLGANPTVSTQLVKLTGLEPGELIAFRSDEHSITISADRNGQAQVPVMLSAAEDGVEARLLRLNRYALGADQVSAQTVAFMGPISLPAGMRHAWAPISNQAAQLTTEFEDRIDVHEFGELVAPVLVSRQRIQTDRHLEELSTDQRQPTSANDLVALNPQPLPPRNAQAAWRRLLRAQGLELPGLIEIHPLPGFDEAPIAIAALVDGSGLVLERNAADGVRVAGTFAGPIGPIDVAGEWALSSGQDQIRIWQVVRD